MMHFVEDEHVTALNKSTSERTANLGSIKCSSSSTALPCLPYSRYSQTHQHVMLQLQAWLPSAPAAAAAAAAATARAALLQIRLRHREASVEVGARVRACVRARVRARARARARACVCVCVCEATKGAYSTKRKARRGGRLPHRGHSPTKRRLLHSDMARRRPCHELAFFYIRVRPLRHPD